MKTTFNAHKESPQKGSLDKLKIGLATLACMLAIPMDAQAYCFPSNPLSSMTITSVFGMRKRPQHPEQIRLHAGVDLRAARMTPVFAVHAGTVTGSMAFSASAGNVIYINGDDGYRSVYMHNDKLIKNKPGTRVSPGEQISFSGATPEKDFAKAPHLHFEVHKPGSNNGMSNGAAMEAVDPAPFFCSGVTESPSARNNSVPSKDGMVIPRPTQVATDGSSGGATGVASPTAETSGGTGAFPVPNFGEWDGMSFIHFIGSEAAKRFVNTQWKRDIFDPNNILRDNPDATPEEIAKATHPKVFLLQELVLMSNLETYMKFERSELRSRIETQLAATLSINAQEYRDRIDRMLRSSANVMK